MADFDGGEDAAAFWRSGLQRSPPQEQLLTPRRNELIRLVKAMENWEQDPTGIFSDEQRAAIAGAAPVLGEEFGDLLLRLALRYRGWPAAAGRLMSKTRYWISLPS
jgi:hypothetical protein